MLTTKSGCYPTSSTPAGNGMSHRSLDDKSWAFIKRLSLIHCKAMMCTPHRVCGGWQLHTLWLLTELLHVYMPVCMHRCGSWLYSCLYCCPTHTHHMGRLCGRTGQQILCAQNLNASSAHLNGLDDVSWPNHRRIIFDITFTCGQSNNCLLHSFMWHQCSFNVIDTRSTGHPPDLLAQNHLAMWQHCVDFPHHDIELPLLCFWLLQDLHTKTQVLHLSC